MGNPNGTINIHGKEYKPVALRVNEFRDEHPEWTIETDIISADERLVVVKAAIRNEEGRLISTGIAEENRTSSRINQTSALENCETSAVGRALAFYKYAGSEIASADEVAQAIAAQNAGDMKGGVKKKVGKGYSRHELYQRVTKQIARMPEDEQQEWRDSLDNATNNEELWNLGVEAKKRADEVEVVY